MPSLVAESIWILSEYRTQTLQDHNPRYVHASPFFSYSVLVKISESCIRYKMVAVWAASLLNQHSHLSMGYFSKTTGNNSPIPPTVERHSSNCQWQHIGKVSAECRPTYRPIVSTDSLLTQGTCRPTLSLVSADISAEHRSIYWPTVGRHIGR